jgi:hypothetical protein
MAQILNAFTVTFYLAQQPPVGHGLLIHSTLDRTPLNEWSARRRDLYLTTHNTHDSHQRPPVGFEPAIPAGEQPQNHALDRAATATESFTATAFPNPSEDRDAAQTTFNTDAQHSQSNQPSCVSHHSRKKNECLRFDSINGFPYAVSYLLAPHLPKTKLVSVFVPNRSFRILFLRLISDLLSCTASPSDSDLEHHNIP